MENGGIDRGVSERDKRHVASVARDCCGCGGSEEERVCAVTAVTSVSYTG